MNRREFLFFRKENDDHRAELSCEQLYMRFIDSTMDDSTTDLFKRVEFGLNDVRVLEIHDTSWLSCEELKPLKSILSDFQRRGGRIKHVVEGFSPRPEARRM
jgi:hypothetical protein